MTRIILLWMNRKKVFFFPIQIVMTMINQLWMTICNFGHYNIIIERHTTIIQEVMIKNISPNKLIQVILYGPLASTFGS